jgi:ketosteroid isomerase-like protein
MRGRRASAMLVRSDANRREELLMIAKTPHDVHRLFAERFRLGDLDGMMELYDPEAIFLTQAGEVVAGTNAIRELLAGFLQLADTFELEHDHAFQSDGVALLQDAWTLQGRDPEGNPVEMADQTAGIARRQADGGWRIVVDNPWGLSSGEGS